MISKKKFGFYAFKSQMRVKITSAVSDEVTAAFSVGGKLRFNLPKNSILQQN